MKIYEKLLNKIIYGKYVNYFHLINSDKHLLHLQLLPAILHFLVLEEPWGLLSRLIEVEVNWNLLEGPLSVLGEPLWNDFFLYTRVLLYP